MAAAGAIGKSIGATEASAKPDKKYIPVKFGYGVAYQFLQDIVNFILQKKEANPQGR